MQGLPRGASVRQNPVGAGLASGLNQAQRNSTRHSVPLNRIARGMLLTLRGVGRVGPVFMFEGQKAGEPEEKH